MNRRLKSSWVSLIVACHLLLIAVVSPAMNTGVAIHHLDFGSQESITSHFHHLSTTHFDHNKSEVLHHHIADNVQPAGLDTISTSFNSPLSQSAFWDSTDPHLLYIHPDGLLRPPRTLL